MVKDHVEPVAMLLGTTNLTCRISCSYLQHVYQRFCSFCYNVLNFYFYIFENLIDIIILLDILLSLIGALSKYLFLSCFKSLRFLFLSFSIIATTFYNIFYNNNFTLSKCCFENINIYILIRQLGHSVWLMFSYLIKRKPFPFLSLLIVL